MICEKHSHVVIGWWTLFLLLHWATKLYKHMRRDDSNSATREPTLIKNCTKLLGANLCWTSEHLGRWLWLEVERKDPSGPSRMVHTVCHNLGWFKFSVLPAQNSTQEYIVAAGCFSVFSLVVLWFHIAQDWKSLIKPCNLCVSTRPATSCDHWFFSPHYVPLNIVYNFIYHKVMAWAPCWCLAPNLSIVRFRLENFPVTGAFQALQDWCIWSLFDNAQPESADIIGVVRAGTSEI
jgi:hypothetical protein